MKNEKLPYTCAKIAAQPNFSFLIFNFQLNGILYLYTSQRHPRHSPSGAKHRGALRAGDRRREPRRASRRVRTGAPDGARLFQGDRATQGMAGQLPPGKPRRGAERLHHQGGHDDSRHDAEGRLREGRGADRRHRFPLDVPRPGAGARKGGDRRRDQHLQGFARRPDLRHLRGHAVRRFGTGPQHPGPQGGADALRRPGDPRLHGTHAHHRPDGILVDRQLLGQDRRSRRGTLFRLAARLAARLRARGARALPGLRKDGLEAHAPDPLHHRQPGIRHLGERRGRVACRWPS